MAIVETRNLTHLFGDVVAVDSVSFSVASGEVFGLLGPNGAGKTTVIKILTTLLRPTSGTATVGGFDVVRQAGQVRRLIGYVPQLLSADGSLTGAENLDVFASLYDIPRRERRQRVDDALAFMGLSDAAHKLVRDYSGGMVRRLEIAEAMLHRPPVLFLDEPTLGLDPLAREAVWNHINELRSEYNTTILLTTHYMEEADSLCARVAIMHRGKLAALGTPNELKASVGGEGVTLDDVFTHYAGDILESGGGYRDTWRTRRAASRLR
jgi:ABC-2 type transport system ATP-binding protein